MASVRQRGPNRFQVLYRIDGKQASKTFADAKQAKKLAALIDLLGPEKGLREMYGDDDQATNRLTVDELFEKWHAWKATTKVTPRTLKDYRRDYDNHIRRHLGHRHADSVDEVDVQKWIDTISALLDPKSVADKHMVLSGMFKFGSARTRRLVPHNPCGETQLPKKAKKQPKGFTLAEWEAIRSWAVAHEPDAADLLIFIASTGWRFSEVTPLTVAAIEDYGDREVEIGGVLHVVPDVFASVLGVHRRDEHDRIVFAEGVAKSKAGMRRINLPGPAAEVIRRRIVGKGPSDLVFTNKRGNQWRSTNFLAREFAAILEGAGIEKVEGMGAHFLRHSQVMMLDRSGVSAAKMQRRIGHENISTTFDTYGGMIDNTLSPEELVRLGSLVAPPPASGQIVAGDIVRGEIE